MAFGKRFTYAQAHRQQTGKDITPKTEDRAVKGKETSEKEPVNAPRAAASKSAFVCAIDPGVHTGFAIKQRSRPGLPGAFVEVSTYTFVQCLRRLEFLCRSMGPGKLFVLLENPRGNRPTFDRGAANQAIENNISQKVGSNKRDAQLWEEFLTELQIPYELITPGKRLYATGKDGKPTQADMNGFKGWPKKSSQHSRDAGYNLLSY